MNRKIVLTMAAALMAGTWFWAEHVISASAQEKEHTSRYQGGSESAPNNEIKQAEINYAGALLKVAQANLAKAQEANSMVSDTIPNSVVRGLEREVMEAEGRYKAMAGGASESVEDPYTAVAKQTLAAAQQSLKQAQDANARSAGAVSQTEVNRRIATVELAKARLQMAVALKSASPIDVMESQLLQLMSDMQEVRAQVGLLQNRN